VTSVAIFNAISLSGKIIYVSHKSLLMPFVISWIIRRRGSVSGSSSVTITISAHWSAIFPISGLLYLSLLPGAPNTRILLHSHLTAFIYDRADLRAFGV
jgi:hypothetical protein